MAMVGGQNGHIMAANTPQSSDLCSSRAKVRIKSSGSEKELKVDFDAQLLKVDSLHKLYSKMFLIPVGFEVAMMLAFGG